MNFPTSINVLFSLLLLSSLLFQRVVLGAQQATTEKCPSDSTDPAALRELGIKLIQEKKYPEARKCFQMSSELLRAAHGIREIPMDQSDPQARMRAEMDKRREDRMRLHGEAADGAEAARMRIREDIETKVHHKEKFTQLAAEERARLIRERQGAAGRGRGDHRHHGYARHQYMDHHDQAARLAEMRRLADEHARMKLDAKAETIREEQRQMAFQAARAAAARKEV